MKRILLAAILTLPIMAKAKFAPENNYRIYPSHDVGADAIAHQTFDKAIDRVYNYYAPIVKAKGYNLVFKRLWDDPTVNSDTDVEGSDWVINSYGGLARYHGMDTVQAYANVACHELGHHLGGSPIFSNEWPWPGGGPSVEGQADYWSSHVCMKAIGFSDLTSKSAGLMLAKVLASLGGEPVPWRPGPVLPIVRRTYEEHPAAQCRLQTFDAGRLNQPRPKCWYAGL